MFTESQTKKVNVVEDVQPSSSEDYVANYVNNSQRGYQRQQYQGQGQQNQWRPNPQGKGNQQWQNDQEMQMRDISREQNPKQKGTLPSDTIANLKGSGSGPTSHIMAITTRSGKVLQGDSEQVVEVEESEQEVEVEETSVVEVEKVPEELKVQEVNREEVKEKQGYEYESISVIDVVDEVEDVVEMKIEEQCLSEALVAILVNFDGENIEGYMESVNALEGLGSYTYAPKNLSLDLENRATPPAKPSIIEPPLMLFGLCNAPATFQKCMMSIFSDMVEDFLEFFMDDFSVVGDSFEHCLNNLRQVLKRCEETNIVLNWEKCHFMVDEVIVLGHKISKHGIEVDREKIEIIFKLHPPTSVKGVRSFLVHAGFYRRFIKVFSKIANPMCKLLEKDATFVFDKKCLKAFEELKQNLTMELISVTPDWSLPFELICDASGVADGAVLGQRHNKVLYPVYYASKTLNGAQMNYTVTEQELLAIVYAFEKF
uniref:Uncharacterized protein LOC104237048 n=1 Tax=Nicotiana sylvestris TaxID=4096 RepID=A0A1U7XSE9_NICSY|nr:PREDICTED: uncharacterized protein LOC104237048 [Nicotiana sylvestris]